MDQATAQQRLAEAEAALHSLMTGSLEEEVTGPDGRHVRYMAQNLTGLQAYINQLQSLVAPRRPIFFGFGR